MVQLPLLQSLHWTGWRSNLIRKPVLVFRIPVNLNQTVDNVKVEDQKNVDFESSESDGKANERCLHVALNDQRVGPVESNPVILMRNQER